MCDRTRRKLGLRIGYTMDRVALLRRLLPTETTLRMDRCAAPIHATIRSKARQLLRGRWNRGTEIMVRRVSATEAVALRFRLLHRARQQSKNLSEQDLDMLRFLQALVLKLSDERGREQLFAGELYRIRLRGHLDNPIRIAPATARFEILQLG